MDISEEVRSGLPTIFLPPIDVVVPGANVSDPSDEHDIEYNAWCNEKIKQALKQQEDDNANRREGWDEEAFGPIPEYIKTTMVMTEYPGDTKSSGNDSRDVVSLDRNGEIIVLDSGVR